MSSTIDLAYMLYIRTEVMAAVASKDDQRLQQMQDQLATIQAVAEARYDGTSMPSLIIIERLLDAIIDFYNDEAWKSTLPQEDEIIKAFATS